MSQLLCTKCRLILPSLTILKPISFCNIFWRKSASHYTEDVLYVILCNVPKRFWLLPRNLHVRAYAVLPTIWSLGRSFQDKVKFYCNIIRDQRENGSPIVVLYNCNFSMCSLCAWILQQGILGEQESGTNAFYSLSRHYPTSLSYPIKVGLLFLAEFKIIKYLLI